MSDQATEADNQENDRSREDESGSQDSSHENGSSRDGISAGEAIRSAREVIGELTGKDPEGVSGINRSGDGGWTISLDVLELSRIPPSTDLLSTYEVSLDGDGGLVDMERTRRYTRNQVNED